SYVAVIHFFFQAEDGIRDRNVTGVQTCALPIFLLNTGLPPASEATKSTSLIKPLVCVRVRPTSSNFPSLSAIIGFVASNAVEIIAVVVDMRPERRISSVEFK